MDVIRHFATRRLLQLLPTFLGVTLLTFLLVRLVPGSPGGLDPEAFAGTGGGASTGALAEWQELQGGGGSFFGTYVAWLGRLLTLDFGHSLVDQRPVLGVLAEALPRTLLLAGLSLLVTYAVAVPLGVVSAARRGSWGERLVALGLFVLYSLPPFFVALMLVVLLAGGEFLTIFPLRGLAAATADDLGLGARVLDIAWHLVLPVLCLAYPSLARTARLQRAAMLEVLGQDYIRTARAKGLPERRVIWRHALRNALVPMAAQLSLDLPWLISGSVIIERIFTIRGMGLLTFEALLRRDYPVIMGSTALAAIVSMAAMLVGDVLHAWLDPRSRLGTTP